MVNSTIANFRLVVAPPAFEHSEQADRDLIWNRMCSLIGSFGRSCYPWLPHKSIALSRLWFAHGGSPDNAVVTEGFASVSVDTWLEVILQLVARINQPSEPPCSSIDPQLASRCR